ncbi:hypothetical protein M2347_002561 [Chryseobacterium sp. H1D6B]|uniref:DUF6705 family protein n=1 Tax=Chryseobacterium sp. H1D6B TaxID=2940588 RepID=UPI0015CC47C4|nr:hypothetical protein [Chryseobacterium sp. H1D6B]MDH6252834.1 hypothetical protein [Chryseobacterium sp. H1D6B]
MKTVNVKIIFCLNLFISILSCKAQQTFPLRTAMDNVPNLSYLKDTNNELQSFTGIYSSSYNGKQIILYISKEENKFFDLGDKKIYRDILSIRYIVKNSAGNVLQDTQNMSFQSNQYTHTIYSQWVTDNGTKAIFNYRGSNCRVGWGKINLKKINITQISWEYRPNDIILDSSKCPSGTDINIYLPETKDLIFTKQ